MSSIVNKIKDVVDDKLHNNSNDGTSSSSNKNNLGNDTYDSSNTRTSNVPQGQQAGGRTTRSGNTSGFTDDSYSSGGMDSSANRAGGAGAAGGAGNVAGRSNLDSGDLRSGGLNSGVGNDYQSGSGAASGLSGATAGSGGISGAGRDPTYGGSSGLGGAQQQAGGLHHHTGQHHAGGLAGQTGSSGYADDTLGSSGVGRTTGATSTGRAGGIGDEFGAVGGGRSNEFGSQTGRSEFASQARNEFGSAGQAAQSGFDDTQNLRGANPGGYTGGNTGIGGAGNNFSTGSGVAATGQRDPTDAAQVPPSVLAKHLGEPTLDHGDVNHDRIRRNSATSHQDTFRGI
ncbi:hypothetical protein SBRCBS47491_001241 [Sporothrix bragantina]|uniref:Cell surface protein n=1 Tax=Sporothrix bragantina TaxID=671064 RepID=A0ABP0AX00_9PEZI